jgi:hypothetical protein
MFPEDSVSVREDCAAVCEEEVEWVDERDDPVPDWWALLVD